ncbi:hypothetical protein ACQBAR_02090 [Propionibacteriaceae bacterium Y1685]
MSKVWFITGASTGLGRAAARAAADNGDTVVATARNVGDIEDFSHRLALDVTDPRAGTDRRRRGSGAARAHRRPGEQRRARPGRRHRGVDR